MSKRDYYETLGVSKSSSPDEIKKAYRKLAQQYHPDKTQNDLYASAQFAEIKEAYEVLTNPAKKEYYLQQRWYNQSIGKRKSQDVITPVTVLIQALELEKYVSLLDVFRMDKKGLEEYILGLLPDSTIEQLKKFNEPETNRQIVTIVIKAMTPLPQAYTESIIPQLEKLSAGDSMAGEILTAFIGKTKRKYKKEKYSLIIIITATLILCLLIFLASR